MKKKKCKPKGGKKCGCGCSKARKTKNYKSDTIEKRPRPEKPPCEFY